VGQSGGQHERKKLEKAMIWFARIGVALAGLFSLAMGLVSYFSPEQLEMALGVGALSPIGLSSIRGDFGAFFLASALVAGLALFAGRPSWLWVGTWLYGIAVIGRFLGLALAGVPEGIAQPIIIELVMITLFTFGARTLAKD